MRMCNNQLELSTRRLRPSDIGAFHHLMSLSTRGQTTLTPDRVQEIFFGQHGPEMEPTTENNPSLKFEIKFMQSNKPVAQAFVAEVSLHLVGYVISHYHYTPWMGHLMQVDDIYVEHSVPKRAIIEKALIDEVIRLAKSDGVEYILFSADKAELDFLKTESKWYRNGHSDWSMLRITY